MLTSEHAIIDFDRGQALPDRLKRQTHGQYVRHAESMLHVYANGVGKTRRQLHQAIEHIFIDEPDCPPRRLRSFCKLLDDASTYQTDRPGAAASLRLRVFDLAARCHPLVQQPDQLFDHTERQVKADIAKQFGRPWPEIENALYADVIDRQRLAAFAGFPDPHALLARYNVAQLQACLYRAQRMTVTATQDFKTILRHVKLSRLLHEVQRLGPGKYRIVLTGPASVLGQTRRYGVNFARFVAALLACGGWQLQAEIQTPWSTVARLALSDRDGLTSHLPPPEQFDSKVEQAFAEKFGEQRDGWRLERETEILHQGQVAFLPDFVFRHDNGTQVYFEIVGFWTPEYLAAKRETLSRFREHRILIAVARSSVRPEAVVGDNVIVYTTALKLAPVLAALNAAGNG